MRHVRHNPPEAQRLAAGRVQATGAAAFGVPPKHENLKHGIPAFYWDTRDIVVAEANSDEPSIVEYEKMARRRFQAPKPKREGRWWYLLVWEDEFVAGERTRKRKRKKIAPASLPEREVRKIAAELMRPVNQGLITVGSATRFEDYVQGTYKPVVLPLMVKSTQDRYQSVIKNYLIPTFGASCLRDVTPLTIQRYLSGAATSGLAHESQDKIRDVLSSILGSAMQYGLLVKNPVEGLRLPPAKRVSVLSPSFLRNNSRRCWPASPSHTPRWFLWRSTPGFESAN